MTLGQAHVDLAKNLTFYFLPSDVTLGQAHVNLEKKMTHQKRGLRTQPED